MRKVVIFGEPFCEQRDELSRHLPGEWHIETLFDDASDRRIEEAMADASVLVSLDFDGRFAKSSALRLIHVPAAGIDRLDLDAVPPGAIVSNCFEHEVAIAEYTMLAMLECQIGLRSLDRGFRRGSWKGGAYYPGWEHGELSGKTLGIVGFGHVGQEVARRAKAFGVQIGAFMRDPSRGAIDAHWVKPVEALDDCLPDLDFLLLACALTPQTKGLIGAGQLGRMKKTAHLINVSRGEIVQEDALFEALDRSWIAGAVIDVWYRYPAHGYDDPQPSKFPFHHLSNVIMTPHASAWSADLLKRRWRVIGENIARFSRNEQVLNIVHKA